MKLRKMIYEDRDLIVKWRNQSFVVCNFIDRRPLTVETHDKWFHNMVEKGKVVQFIIISDDNKEIGSVFLRDIDYEKRIAELGVFIGEASYLGKGYGTRAVKQLCEYAFDEMKLDRVFLRVISENERAIRSYEKSGFIREKQTVDTFSSDNTPITEIFMYIENKKEGA